MRSKRQIETDTATENMGRRARESPSADAFLDAEENGFIRENGEE